MGKKKLKWNTEERKVNDLIPYEGNPRQMSQKQKEDLEESLKRFNLMSIPVVNTDNIIVSGHQRLKILQLLGRGEEVIDVRVPNRDLSPEELQEANLRENKNLGSWDDDLLANIDKEVLLDVGFTEEELDDKFNLDRGKDDEDGFDINKALEEIKKPVCKQGDIWQLGEHRLMCGDATVEEDVKKLMGGEKADMVFTDPPYNIDIKYASYQDKDLNYWNKVDIWMDLINQYSKKDFSIYVKQYTFNILNTILSFKKIKINIRNIIIWKTMSMAHPNNNYDNSYEIIIYGIKGQPIFNTWTEKREKPENYWSGRGIEFKGKINNIWDDITPIYAGCIQMSDMENIENKKQHPTEMPIKLPTRAINFSSIENNIVLDLFGGSGSTLIACEQLNRKCYMMEIDPIYCDVIINRWEKYTDEKAVKIDR